MPIEGFSYWFDAWEDYKQLTSDHSLVNELLKAGQITPEEAERHPQRNIITQSIGQRDEIAA